MRETWRQVVGFEGYYSVSNTGRVRSEPRVVRHSSGGEMRRTGGPLKQNPNAHGYPCVQLCRDGAIKNRPVYILVLEAFKGPRPPGLEGCHRDNDRTNSRAANLRWDTRAGNFADMIEHGTRRRGTKHALAKLTAEQVLAIRADDRILRLIAADYGIAISNVHSIKARLSWAWLA